MTTATQWAVYRRLRGSRPGVRWDRVCLPTHAHKRAVRVYGPAIVSSRIAALANDPRAEYDYALAPIGSQPTRIAGRRA